MIFSFISLVQRYNKKTRLPNISTTFFDFFFTANRYRSHYRFLIVSFALAVFTSSLAFFLRLVTKIWVKSVPNALTS